MNFGSFLGRVKPGSQTPILSLSSYLSVFMDEYVCETN